jgi:lysophospholipase L1-like esterase
MAFPKWAVLPGVVGGAVVLTTVLLTQRGSVTASSQVNAVMPKDPSFQVAQAFPSPRSATSPSPSQGGDRYQLSYDQWVNLLAREAAVVAQKRPAQLYVLAGDSLSLWFPHELLPEGVTWLNQGISGETSYGLLRRVALFDQTQPQTIFVMIGINDLVRGFRYETVAANHREIIRHLKATHPQAKIVVQSILPHGGDRVTQRYLASVKDDPAPEQNTPPLWVKRLPVITNPSIQRLNQRLAAIAREEKVEFLDLYPQFADAQGNLREDLTTDGLHLSPAGYAVWRSQLLSFLPTVLSEKAPKP